jgi:hypothetical protein
VRLKVVHVEDHHVLPARNVLRAQELDKIQGRLCFATIPESLGSSGGCVILWV